MVRDIRGDRMVRKRKEYKVIWEGYPSSEADWVPASNINFEARKNYIAKTRKT